MGRVISTAISFIDGFTKPSKEVIKSMKQMGKESIAAGKQIQSAGKSISSAGASLTKSITLPLVAVGTAALKTSNDFENAMAKVGTIADTTSTPMKTLKKQVIDLSNTMGVSVTEIAGAQYEAISSGVETAKSVGFVATAIKAAKGGFTDTATAVDGLTTVLNAYGLKASAAGKISDQMLIAQNYGKTTFGDMASSIGNVIPIASSLNVSTKELFSSVAVLTNNGIGTSEAMTGLKAAYSNILKPSNAAAKTAKELGLNFSSAHLKSVGWAKFLEEIKEKTGGNAETMAQLFGSTEALNTVMVLAGKGSAGFAEALKQMDSASGSTQAAYEKMLTPTEKMNISINKVKNSLIKFGTALTPVFTKVADIIGAVGDKLSNLSEGQVNSIVKFAAIAAAVGPALMIFGKMVVGISALHTNFGLLAIKVANMGGVMGVITSPAAIVIGVLAAIVVAGVLIYKNWDKIKAAAQKVGAVIKSVFLKSGIDVSKFKNTFSSMKETIGVIVNNLKLIIGKIITFLKPIVTFIVNVFVARIKIAFLAAVGFVSGFASGIMQYINGVLKMFKGITEFIAGVFTGDWKRAFNGIKTFFEGWGTAIVGLIKTPINAIIGLINGAIKGVNELGIKIPDWVPVIGGKGFSINIPTIPMLYKGTDNWRGGAAVINDRKGEIVDLPKGSRVYPHDKSVQMARKEGAASAGRSISITINKLADKLEVRNDGDIDKIADALARKLQKVSLNMGVA